MDPDIEIIEIPGTEDADTLEGTEARERILGFGGDDSLTGGWGDTLDGGPGNDTLDGSQDIRVTAAFSGPEDVIVNLAEGTAAGQGDDVLIGIDNVIGGSGSDHLIGNDGSNSLTGNAGDDTLDGGAGYDFAIYDGLEAVTIDLNRPVQNTPYGTDVLISIEHLVGGLGGDHFTGTDEANQLRGNGGADTLLGGGAFDLLDGGDGDDWLEGGEGDDLLLGGSGNDRIDGGDGDRDVFAYFGSADLTIDLRIQGENTRQNTGEGWDTLIGIEQIHSGEGNDWLIGNDQNNRLVGSAGNDTLAGGGGDDTLEGGEGADIYVFGPERGQDMISDFEAADRIDLTAFGPLTFEQVLALTTNIPDYLHDPTPSATIVFADGPSIVLQNVSKSSLRADQFILTPPEQEPEEPGGGQPGGGGSEAPRVEIIGDAGANLLVGNALDNRIYGRDGNDRLYGREGHDRLWGHKGKDRLYGEAGNDRLSGGEHNDVLTGGAGKDVFVFDAKLGSAKTDRKVNFDKILDFNVKDDSIWLDNKIFKKLGKKGSEQKPAKLSKKFFTIGDKAKDKDDYLIYDKKKGILLYDPDGSGAKQAIEFASLKKNLKLTHKDFFVI